MYFVLWGLLTVASASQKFLQPLPSYRSLPLKRREVDDEYRKGKIVFLQAHATAVEEEGDGYFVQTTTELKSMLTMTNYANTEYVGAVGIGSPPQFLDVILDTGSANFWVNSKLCHDRSCRQQTAYDHDQSSTFDEIGLTLEVEFGSGIVDGIINEDTVFLCGVEVKNQQIGEITDEYGAVFYDAKFAGILGLAYPSMAAYDFDPVFDNIMEQELLDANIMTFYYSLDPNEQSVMTIGGVNGDLFEGEITWVNVMRDHHYYWLIEMDDVRIGNKSYDLCSKGCRAAVDTGTSMLTAPSHAYKKMKKKLKLNCNDLSSIPDLVFVIAGVEFPLPAKEFVLTYTSKGEEDPGIHSEKVIDCMLAFMAMDISEPEGPLWVLGDIFLSRYYTIFDRDYDRVGFAKAVHSYD
mmetsp:Transcript_17224/g.30978  ORF Transcript_17224/g.30978 Transcript_17224/m.30978 type:complete len:407 (+) Transcript_17224:5538-6758(+)